jgi:polyhydroxyalkanoate synthesis regulator phasin
MPAARSSSGRSRAGRGGKPAQRSSASPASKRKAPGTTSTRSTADQGGASKASLAEQLANRIIKPLDLIIISRERIEQTLDEAAERGRVTRADANELVTELVNRGRAQTDELLRDLERLLGRGREQLESATRRVRGTDSLDKIVRSADRARRTVGVGPSFPILGYDDLTAGQVEQRLAGLKPAELRKVRDYERRHANRKTVLEAVERALA